MKEQLPLPFEEEHVELPERDECPACGNLFASPGSCNHCVGNKEKVAYLQENPDAKLKRIAPRTYGKKR